MSPGNSYFKEEIIIRLIDSVVKKYHRAAVLIADIPAISTYIALGYPENRARRDKAIPQGNALKNKTLSCRSRLGLSEEQLRIFDWAREIEPTETYQSAYKNVTTLYETSPSFREAARNATAEVLEYAQKDIADRDAAIGTAVHYLLAEIAFLECAPTLLDVDQVIYIYHRRWPVFESYIAGEFDGKVRKYLGFEMVEML